MLFASIPTLSLVCLDWHTTVGGQSRLGSLNTPGCGRLRCLGCGRPSFVATASLMARQLASLFSSRYLLAVKLVSDLFFDTNASMAWGPTNWSPYVKWRFDAYQASTGSYRRCLMLGFDLTVEAGSEQTGLRAPNCIVQRRRAFACISNAATTRSRHTDVSLGESIKPESSPGRGFTHRVLATPVKRFSVPVICSGHLFLLADSAGLGTRFKSARVLVF